MIDSSQRVEPRPAATVVLLRPGAAGPEALLIQRPSTMAFAPGLHAFPGGAVDAEDLVAGSATASADEAHRALGRNVPPELALGVHRAAVREVAEEVGISVDPAALVPVALWTTPVFMPRRFATWFFVADLPGAARPVFAAREVAGHRWLTPRAALEAMAAGELEMWVPTSAVLERLVTIGPAGAADVAAAIRIGRLRPPRIVEEAETVVRFAVSGAGALPGRAGETSILGRRDVVIVDPGDPSEPAIDAIRAAAGRRGATIRAIVLTETDPDHAAGAEALAIPLEVPVLHAPGAGRFLPYETRELADGERLPTDGDLRVHLGPSAAGRLQVVAGTRAG